MLDRVAREGIPIMRALSVKKSLLHPRGLLQILVICIEHVVQSWVLVEVDQGLGR